MAALFKWYDRATLYAENGTYNAGSPQISIAAQPITVCLLTSTYTFSASHNVYGDLTNELTTSGGYTAGGVALGSITFVQSSTVSNLDAADATWTASGGGIPAFRFAVLYINATVNAIVKPLIACIDNNGVDVPATTAPNVLTVAWNATGIWQVAHS